MLESTLKPEHCADPNRAEADPYAAELIAIGESAVPKGAPIVRARFELMAVNRRKGYVPLTDAAGRAETNGIGEPSMRLGETVTVELLHVAGVSGCPDDPNTRSWLAVPKGSIEIQVTDEAAVKQFVIGREYVVTIGAGDSSES
jgi:hypothetical protein